MSTDLRAGVATRALAALRDVPDFPRAGIVFKDITPLLGDASLFRDVVATMAAEFRGLGLTHVAGIESRGFIFAAPLALALDVGFIPIRKPGKLPARVVGLDYALEYGADRLEVHADACAAGATVLLVDDVLATGGTALAAATLLEGLGATVAACAFLLEIAPLGGAARLAPRRTSALLRA